MTQPNGTAQKSRKKKKPANERSAIVVYLPVAIYLAIIVILLIAFPYGGP